MIPVSTQILWDVVAVVVVARVSRTTILAHTPTAPVTAAAAGAGKQVSRTTIRLILSAMAAVAADA